jgi:hypothetical protein
MSDWILFIVMVIAIMILSGTVCMLLVQFGYI